MGTVATLNSPPWLLTTVYHRDSVASMKRIAEQYEFFKIYGKLLLSSSLIDAPSDAFKLFFVMIALADAEGSVNVSGIMQLARMAGMKPSDAQDAITILESPDQHSRDDSHGGARVVKDGTGWRVVNYRKYRDVQTPAAERQRKSRQRKADKRFAAVDRAHAAMMSPEGLTPDDMAFLDTPEEAALRATARPNKKESVSDLVGCEQEPSAGSENGYDKEDRSVSSFDYVCGNSESF